MTWLTNFWRQEPVVIIGLVSAAIALAAAFGYALTPTQTTAVLGFIGALMAVVRSQVQPAAVAKAQLLTALTMPVGATENDVLSKVKYRPEQVPALDTPPSTIPGVPKIGLLLLACVLAGGAVLPACGRTTPSTIVTPQGKVAYQIEDLVAALGTIQHAAITASHQHEIGRATALKVTRSVRVVAKTLDTAIDAGTGTAAVYQAASTALGQLYLDPDLARFKPEIMSAQLIVAALQGGTK